MSNLVRWNPFREMAEMQRALDRMFEDTWRGAWPTTFAGNTLTLDVIETDTNYTASVALPGIEPDHINVKMQDDTLTISAELPQPALPDNARVLIQERPYGQFTRSVRLPQPVQTDKVEATYENGVLTLVLPKLPEVQPKQISVKVGKLLKSKN